MEIVVTNESDIFIFAIQGRLDAVSVPQLEGRSASGLNNREQNWFSIWTARLYQQRRPESISGDR